MDPLYLAYLLIAVGVVLVVAELFVPSGFVLVVIGTCCALSRILRSANASPLHRAMTPMCLRITRSRRWFPRTSFTYAEAAWWTAANFIGKTLQNSIPTNLCHRC